MSIRVIRYDMYVDISVSFTRTIDVTVFVSFRNVFSSVLWRCLHINDEKIKGVDDKYTEKLTVRVNEALYFCHLRNSLFNGFGRSGLLLKGYMQLYFPPPSTFWIYPFRFML